MSIKGLLRLTVLAFLFVAFQGTWVLAGTTGSITGVVTDNTGRPIAGAFVTASSPSQTVKGTTDSKGFYSLLNLSPDTYAVTASKDSYDPTTVNGLTVQADQITRGDVSLRPSATVLGHVTATAQTSVVNKTVTGDLYAVSGAAINAYQGSAGGAETLYSQNGVVGSLPGVVRSVGGGGSYNGQGTLSLRGGAFDQVGYELEGIPLNRGFDFYNSTSFVSNGLASIEVYTGGEPADAGRAMSGYVNGTINRGRYPGGSDLSLALGSPTYNHTINMDVYGATPSGRFSYYVSTLAVNVGYNWGDRNNLDNHTLNVPANDPGCAAYNAIASGNGNPTLNCAVANSLNVPMSESVFYNNSNPFNAERDTVANLHWTMGHGGLSDDLQALFVNGSTGGPFPYSGGMMDPIFYNFEVGGGNVGRRLIWPVGTQYLGSTNTPFDPAASKNLTWPTSGGSTGFIPTTFVDSQGTQYSIAKLGYTRALSQSSFLRVFGYSLYSAWSIDEPTEGLNGGTFYQLHDNATGFTANYQNQINSQHLLKVDVDYSKDLTLRYNYGNYVPQQRFRGAASEPGGFVVCGTLSDWNTLAACAPGDNVAQIKGPYGYWSSTTPIVSDAVFADAFHPTDKLQFDIGVRFDQFKFALMPLQITGANGLAEQAQNQFGICLHGYAYAAGEPCNGYLTTFAAALAAAGSPRPDFLPGAAPWKDVSGDLTFNEFSPRFGVTYTATPRDVLRFSVGRYVQPPNSAFEEYRAAPFWGAGDTVSILNRFWDGLGFLALHNVQPEDSTNYDGSIEHDFTNGISAKVTPFIRNTRGQILNLPVNPAQPSFVTGYNFGNARIRGAEFLVSKTRLTENGLSASFAATYTDVKVRFNKGPNGQSIIDLINATITAYNAANPGNQQPLEDPSGYYSPSFTQTGPTQNSYDVRWVMNLNLDERVNGWDISPTFNYQSGNPYGDPLNFGGVPDPYTGKFDQFGSLSGPSWLTMNLGISRDIGHSTKAGLLFSNLFTSIHNHGYAWEYPTGTGVIGYGGSDFYTLNVIGPNPSPTGGYAGQNYYPYTPSNVMPLRQVTFSLSTKL